MSFTEEDKEKMDQAAQGAKKDLDTIPNDYIISLANWWKKWYMKAGHKRLARVLLQNTKEEEK